MGRGGGVGGVGGWGYILVGFNVCECLCLFPLNGLSPSMFVLGLHLRYGIACVNLLGTLRRVVLEAMK